MKPRDAVWEEVKTDAPPAGGGASSPAGSDVNWEAESDLSTEHEGDVLETPTPPQAATPPAAPSTPETPKAPETPTPQGEPATPLPSAAAPATPEAPTPPALEAPVDMQALRTKEIERLTAAYGLNEEDARNVLVEPERVLPRLLAQLHVNTVDAVVSAVFSRLPQVVTSISTQANAAREAENEFFGVWPQLRDAKHRHVVENAIRGYKQLNPKATRQELIRAAGLNALITLRLPIPQELLVAPPPPAPASGFSPAAPGGAPATPASGNRPTNPFTLLNEEFDSDERG